MKKIKYIIHNLKAEYKMLHKPSKHELIVETGKIAGCTCIAAIILKLVDTGFAVILGLIL